MKAITTKYLPVTTYCGSRIKAYEPDGKSITLHYAHELNATENHIAAAKALCAKLDWHGDLVGGHTKDGMVFVFDTGAYKFSV